MKGTPILLMFLIASLCFLGCDSTQSSSGPIESTEIEKQNLAKRPEGISITALLCAGTDPSSTIGTWESSGLFEDMGNASSQAAGHGPTLPPNLVEGELLLESQVGTITIRFQEPHSLPSPGFPVLNVREGTWVILRGTDGYRNLQGQGTIRIELRADVEGECGGLPNLKIPAELNGVAHFNP
jgi:hypothetical protein